MSAQSIAISEDVRKSIYDDLAELMIGALEREELSIGEMKKSAAYILGTLDSIQNEDQLIEFLRSLSSKWKSYAVELTKFEGKKQLYVDEQKIKEIQGRLSQFIKKPNG